MVNQALKEILNRDDLDSFEIEDSGSVTNELIENFWERMDTDLSREGNDETFN